MTNLVLAFMTGYFAKRICAGLVSLVGYVVGLFRK